MLLVELALATLVVEMTSFVAHRLHPRHVYQPQHNLHLPPCIDIVPPVGRLETI